MYMEKEEKTLGEILPGESLNISAVGTGSHVWRRLGELGFTEGATVDKLYVGFGGSPIAVRVSGAVIAVRREDANKIKGRQTF